MKSQILNLKSKILNNIVPILAGVAVFMLVGIIAIASTTTTTRTTTSEVVRLTDEEIFAELQKFATIFNMARDMFVEEVDERRMLEAAMNAMLSSLDRHSSYLNLDEMRQFTQRTGGTFGGLGIQVTASERGGFIRVISPIDDTPAERAGIGAGDLITHIDGESVRDMTLNQAVRKMQGRPGTNVRLTIIQDDNPPRVIRLTRAQIRVRSVRYEIKNDNVGYIRIADFGAQTTREIREAIASLNRQNVIGFVLDVRNNPGGYLNAAINVSDAFLTVGDGIVSTRGRGGREIDNAVARGEDLALGKPLVVLINQGSASASEIVAGAIQDNRRGIIMGMRSYGKGSVQQQRPLGDGTAIHITVARYFTPLGREIHGNGVEPDIEVAQSRVEIIERRRELFTERTTLGEIGERRGRRAQATENAEEEGGDAPAERTDYQLSRALDMVVALSRVGNREVSNEE